MTAVLSYAPVFCVEHVSNPRTFPQSPLWLILNHLVRILAHFVAWKILVNTLKVRVKDRLKYKTIEKG